MQNLKLVSVLLIGSFAITGCCPLAFQCGQSLMVKPKFPKELTEPPANLDLLNASRTSQPEASETPAK